MSRTRDLFTDANAVFPPELTLNRPQYTLVRRHLQLACMLAERKGEDPYVAISREITEFIRVAEDFQIRLPR